MCRSARVPSPAAKAVVLMLNRSKSSLRVYGTQFVQSVEDRRVRAVVDLNSRFTAEVTCLYRTSNDSSPWRDIGVFWQGIRRMRAVVTTHAPP
jgi:hypothetical protein